MFPLSVGCAFLFVSIAVLPCCEGPYPNQERGPGHRAPNAAQGGEPRALPAEDGADLSLRGAEARLAFAMHTLRISGDRRGARAQLHALLKDPGGVRTVRAQAALALAELADYSGDRRGAVTLLERAKSLAGDSTLVARVAADRRSRIVSEAPLAEVRGPVPGTVKVRDVNRVVASYRQAERKLAAFHRMSITARLETMDSQRAAKRRALKRAVSAYQRVIETGNTGAKAAALFRIAAMYHHMAEVLAFTLPPELLPKLARALKRELRAESAGYLRKALAHYRRVVALPKWPGTAAWRGLAARQAKMLALVLAGRRGR